jgi:hypothetical protein
MRISSYRIGKQIAVCLALFSALPMSEVAAAMPLPMFSPQQTQSAPAQDQPPPAGTQTQSPQSSAAQASSDQSPNGFTKPVGTAAARAETITGVAATRPVGAAIAPAKQRRARAILIRVSVVVGAAVAIGTVVALSGASPSKPK